MVFRPLVPTEVGGQRWGLGPQRSERVAEGLCAEWRHARGLVVVENDLGLSAGPKPWPPKP